MKELLNFDNMVTPKIIQVIYWLLLAGCVISGLSTLFGLLGQGRFFAGLFGGILIIVFGALFVRIWCELLIVLFKMNEALQEIRQK